MTTDTIPEPAATEPAAPWLSAETFTVGLFDPDKVVVGENVRKNAEATLTDDFLARIKATGGNKYAGGVTLREDGTPVVRYGFRRHAACARQALPYKAIIIGADDDPGAERRARILDQMHENAGREDLTPSDEAAGMLALFDPPEGGKGMTAAAIGKALGRDTKEIKAAISVARSPQAAAAADIPGVDLLHAAVIAEFDDDREAAERLTSVAERDPAQFDHTAARLRETAAERRERDAFAATLEEEGLRVVTERYVPAYKQLKYLRDGDGQPLIPEGHASCPGHAVQIVEDWAWAPGAEQAFREANGLGPDDDFEFTSDEEANEAGYRVCWQPGPFLCTHPDEHGHVYGSHTQQSTASTDPEAQKAAKSEQRRRVIAGNKEWRAATSERQKFLRTVAGWKNPPAGARELVDEAFGCPSWELINAWQKGNSLAAKLAGVPNGGGKEKIREIIRQSSAKRATVINLVVLLAASEDPVSDDSVWRTDGMAHSVGRRTAKEYLPYLRDVLGYTLSPIEEAVAKGETYNPLAGDEARQPGADELAGDETADEQVNDDDETAGSEAGEDEHAGGEGDVG